ncbi:hypothetical protein B0T10DRAFT_604555 [Thelonectria olida]|uniref:DUF6546 domain-containing protein n=1 Tax=Thelonectria olida TaxID=1576542 RepID=A0A9P9APH1_9HYPO|nr:hypothetical protein B0T10DRAFT_604555 [Thelonectria olida]
MPWYSLPPEIRNPILKLVAGTHDGKLTPYVTVCKEWQPIFEQVTLSDVLLYNDFEDVQKFRAIYNRFPDRQRSLAMIRFHIRLPGGPMPRRGWDIERDLVQCISVLFGMMSKWNQNLVYGGPDGGVGLDLRVDLGYQPWVGEKLRDITLKLDFFEKNPEWAEWLERNRHTEDSDSEDDDEEDVAVFSDEEEGEPDDSAVGIVFPEPPRRVGPRGLPLVKFVDVFMYVGSQYLDINYGTVYDIIASLPSVVIIHIESRFGYGQGMLDFAQPRISMHTVGIIPRRLMTRMSNINRAGSLERPGMWPPHVKYIAYLEHSAFVARRTGRPEIPSRALAAKVVENTFGVKGLVVSNAVDAIDFFAKAAIINSIAPQKWVNLTHLTLTAPVFSENASRFLDAHRRANELLMAAGDAARRMPKLLCMELWGFSPYITNAFRYVVNDDDKMATIAWVGHWDFPFIEDVQWVWRDMADDQGYKLQVIEKQTLEGRHEWHHIARYQVGSV